MTLFRILKNITCTDSAVCHEKIQAKIEAERGVKLHINDGNDELEKQEGYLHIIHKQGNHLIIVNIYDEVNKHEFVSGLELHDFNHTGILTERPLRVTTDPLELTKNKVATSPTPKKSDLELDIDNRDK